MNSQENAIEQETKLAMQTMRRIKPLVVAHIEMDQSSAMETLQNRLDRLSAMVDVEFDSSLSLQWQPLQWSQMENDDFI